MAREALNLTMTMTPENRRRIQVFVSTITGLYRVCIKPARAGRTSPQNRFFHGPVVECMIAYQLEQGITWTEQETKDFFKMRFLKKSEPDKKTGELMETIRETHKLDVNEFSIFLEQCLAFCAEWGITLPDQALYYQEPTK